MEPEVPAREPPLHGAAERSAPAPAIRSAAALLVAQVVDSLDQGATHTTETTARRLEISSDVENDRHRAVVDELDPHASTEDAARDRYALCSERVAEPLVERLREVGRRRVGEARAVALRGIRLYR